MGATRRQAGQVGGGDGLTGARLRRDSHHLCTPEVGPKCLGNADIAFLVLAALQRAGEDFALEQSRQLSNAYQCVIKLSLISNREMELDELEDFFVKTLGFRFLGEKQLKGIFKRAGGEEKGFITLDEWMADAPKTLKTNLLKLAKTNGGDLGFLV